MELGISLSCFSGNRARRNRDGVWAGKARMNKTSTAESQARGMQDLWRTYGQEKKFGHGICFIGKVQDNHLHVLGLFSCRVPT